MKMKLGFIFLASIYSMSASAFTPAPLTVTTYDPAELRAVGCDPAIMDRLNAEYLAKRSFDRQREGAILVKDQIAQAPDASVFSGATGGRTCIESAMNTVQGVANQINNLVSIFSGAMTSAGQDQIKNQILNQVTNLACTQVNRYANDVVYDSTQSVRSAVGSITGDVTGSYVETSIGNINVGGAVGGARSHGTDWYESISSGVFK